ncbi:ketoacyl-ACP synthase III [Nocardia sp. NBC_01499]|uniref:beta-ketoacyl-ACP synthase III n=1 Tax=Nocardia sp. NBC_01499 TaxID=2903597 RepID=UPI00386CCA5C
MTRAAVLAGLGAALPPHLVTNADLADVLATSDDWIRTRTGIATRYVIEPGSATSDLAVEAGQRALASADTHRVDLVVLATSTPDHPCPATAPAVAWRLGLGGVPAFDIAAVCSGFVYALAVAAGQIALGITQRALVIGADTFSTIIDPADRTTRAIFGDAAGAVVLRAGERDEPGALLGFDLGSDGEHADLITVPAGGSRERSTPHSVAAAKRYFTMQGRDVFYRAVVSMTESATSVLKQTNWSIDQVDRLVAHQANLRILHSVADQLGMDHDSVVVNLDRVGNTVAASIPLALADAVLGATLREGHRVVLSGFGGGLTWGSTALRWPDVAVAPFYPEYQEKQYGGKTK